MPVPVFETPYPERSTLNAFSGNPLNRRSETRSKTCVADALADPRAQLFFITSGKLIIRDTDETSAAIFTPGDMEAFNALSGAIVLLGWDSDETPWLAAQADLDIDALPEGLKAVGFRDLYIQGLLSDAHLGMVAQGGALIAWHNSHQFCSRCGAPSLIEDGGYKRHCPNCEMDHFPRTDPVVIMLTTTPDNEKCLLGRSPHFVQGVYSCLAGFVEPGETIEAAMRRETMEETSIDVERVAYHSSQPWPFPYTLMIGCVGVAKSQDIRIDDELEDARWFSRTDVQAMVDGTHSEQFRLPPAGAIASRLIVDWLKR